MKTIRYRSGVNALQREVIRKRLAQLVSKLQSEMSLPAEAIVLEMRYFHQSASNPHRTTASAQDKRATFEAHGRRCCAVGCSKPLSIQKAVFHHLKRGCRNQHSPRNLLPFCEECHNKVHKASQGSLLKGSPRQGKGE